MRPSPFFLYSVFVFSFTPHLVPCIPLIDSAKINFVLQVLGFCWEILSNVLGFSIDFKVIKEINSECYILTLTFTG